MSFLKYKSYFQLLRRFNKNNWSSVSHNYFVRSKNNMKTMLITRSIISRPEEMDTIKRQSKSYKQKTEFTPQIEYQQFQEDENTENIDLQGYLLLLIPLVSLGLGIWQIERRKWKLDLIQNLEEKFSNSPIPIPENLNDLDNLEYHPLKVEGEFLYDNEFIIGPRSLIIDGKAASEGIKNLQTYSDYNRGYHVITPFKLKNKDLTILVNRGWVPNKYKNASERAKYQVKGIVEIVGINRLNEKRPQFVFKNIPEQGLWNYRDVNEMAKFANTEPIFLDMIQSDKELEIPIASQTRVNLRNEHLSYIITWFGLSAFTGYYWFRIFIQKRPIF